MGQTHGQINQISKREENTGTKGNPEYRERIKKKQDIGNQDTLRNAV